MAISSLTMFSTFICTEWQRSLLSMTMSFFTRTEWRNKLMTPSQQFNDTNTNFHIQRFRNEPEETWYKPIDLTFIHIAYSMLTMTVWLICSLTRQVSEVLDQRSLQWYVMRNTGSHLNYSHVNCKPCWAIEIDSKLICVFVWPIGYGRHLSCERVCV